MVRSVIFLACVALGIVTVAAFAARYPTGDPFGDQNPPKNVHLSELDALQLANAKVNHARSSPAYDIGLFGNSRIINVSADDVDLPGCRAFNFAIGGESVRGSVALLERLAHEGVAPRVAVISVDNMAIQMFSNALVVPAIDRARLSAQDVVHVVSTEPSNIRALAKSAFRWIWTEGHVATYTFFRFETLKHAVHQAVGRTTFETLGSSSRGFRYDGSFHYLPLSATPDIPPMATRSRQILPSLLKRDLGRLAQLRNDAGIRIIVFESLLHPDAKPINAVHKTLTATSRDEMARICGDLGLMCLLGSDGSESGPPWSDGTHAPAQQIAQLIRSQIMATSNCAS